MSGSNPLILVKSSQAGLQCRLLESPFRRGFKSWRCLLLELEKEGRIIVFDKCGRSPKPAEKRRKLQGKPTLAETYYIALP
jgi:hypothetical protein